MSKGALCMRDFTKNTLSKTLKPVGITNVFPRVKISFQPPKSLSILQEVFLVKFQGRKHLSNIMVVIYTPTVWSHEAYTIDDIIYF